jgi:hypothetical protein
MRSDVVVEVLRYPDVEVKLLQSMNARSWAVFHGNGIRGNRVEV